MKKSELLKYRRVTDIEENIRDIDSVVRECQRYIQLTTVNVGEKAEDTRENAIMAYVEKYSPVVRGTKTLMDVYNKLRDEIIGKSVIEKYYDSDPNNEIGFNTEEIQLNGEDQIFVKSYGEMRKADVEFESQEQYERFVDRLIQPERLSENKLYVDTATPEGYRINATHRSLNKHKRSVVTIRKLDTGNVNEVRMVCEFKSMTVNMYKLLSLIPRASMSWFCIGGTGSGKTTLNDAIRKHIPLSLRTIYIESPSEINGIMYGTDANGNYGVINNVIQYEAKQVSKDIAMEENAPSTSRIFVNTLRQTPDIIGVGELRFSTEFELCLRAANSGHVVFSTYHSEGIERGLRRYLNEVIQEYNGGDPNYLMSSITDAVNIVIHQQQFTSTGERKVMEIAEVLGAEGATPIYNTIYRYVPEDTEGNKIIGKFKRVGAISENFKRKLIMGGVPRHEWEYLTKPVAKVKLTIKENDKVEEVEEEVYNERRIEELKLEAKKSMGRIKIEINEYTEEELFDEEILKLSLPKYSA